MIFKGLDLSATNVARLEQGVYTNVNITLDASTLKDNYYTIIIKANEGQCKSRCYLPNGNYPLATETKQQAIDREEGMIMSYLDKLVSAHTDTTKMEYDNLVKAIEELSNIQNKAECSYNVIITENNGYTGIKSTKYSSCFEKYIEGKETTLKLTVKEPNIIPEGSDDDYPF